MPQGAPRANYLTGLSVVGVQQIDRIVEIVEETLKGMAIVIIYPTGLVGLVVAGTIPESRKRISIRNLLITVTESRFMPG